VEGRAEEDVAGNWIILLARRTRTIKMCSFDARSEGQSSHPLDEMSSSLGGGGKDGMEADDLLCSRNARPRKNGKGSSRTILLAR
jgi:hypothetical protein